MLNEQQIYNKFKIEFSNLIKEQHLKKITFLCIGTSKVIGDSIGPIVGTNLKSNLKQSKKITIIGDLNKNLHYENIKNISTNNLKQEAVIVIDSALSSKENIGKIIVQKNALKYGEGLKKKNGNIGDISIKAVVEKNTNNKFINFYKLKKASAENVEIMANIISKGIAESINL
jgi:putative sporulation protein YyaC